MLLHSQLLSLIFLHEALASLTNPEAGQAVLARDNYYYICLQLLCTDYFLLHHCRHPRRHLQLPPEVLNPEETAIDHRGNLAPDRQI